MKTILERTEAGIELIKKLHLVPQVTDYMLQVIKEPLPMIVMEVTVRMSDSFGKTELEKMCEDSGLEPDLQTYEVKMIDDEEHIVASYELF